MSLAFYCPVKLCKYSYSIWHISPDNQGKYKCMLVCTINLDVNALVGVNCFFLLSPQLLAVFGGWAPVCLCWTCSCCCSGMFQSSDVQFLLSYADKYKGNVYFQQRGQVLILEVLILLYEIQLSCLHSIRGNQALEIHRALHRL